MGLAGSGGKRANALAWIAFWFLAGAPVAARAEPHVDTWFESNEYTKDLLSLAAQVGVPKVYGSGPDGIQCSRRQYIQTMLQTRIEWGDFSAAGGRVDCSSEGNELIPYCYSPKDGGILRMSLSVWQSSRDEERLKLAISAILKACGSPPFDPSNGAIELISRLKLARGYAPPELPAKVQRPAPSSTRGLIHVPQSDLSQTSFEHDENGSSLTYQITQLGTGVHVDNTGLRLTGSMLAHGVVGRPTDSENTGALTYLVRGNFMGGQTPLYEFSLDAMGGMWPAPGIYLAVQANRLPNWKTMETLVNFGLTAPPIFLKMGERSYLMFEASLAVSSWKTPVQRTSGTEEDLGAHAALGAFLQTIARLGDFLVTSGVHANTQNDQGGPSRVDAHASVSIPVRLLLSDEYLRLQVSHETIFSGKVSETTGLNNDRVDTEVPHLSNTSLDLTYEARF